VDQDTASLVVDMWSRGSGVVARGPKMLLSIVPAERTEVERLTGRRTVGVASKIWRLEVSGRFLASGGVVYPGGVPFPEELHSQTAVIANEVWLYADDDGDVLGSYWWPDAVRRPIASVPRADFPESMCVHPLDAHKFLDIPVPLPSREPWEPTIAVCLDSSEVLVFCMPRAVEPLNEMLVYESGGVSVRAKLTVQRPDINAFLQSHQPPYRRVQVGSRPGLGRDLGRALGPQTWPWPGEVRWWDEGVLFEVKGFELVTTLLDVAESIER
jgi:hypothetical protein